MGFQVKISKHNPAFTLAALSCAVALAIGTARAGQDYQVTTARVQQPSADRTLSVRDFADTAVGVMKSPASGRYLGNRKLADSSTFASRLVDLMQNRRFTVAPTLPIPARDLSCYTDVPSYSRPLEFDVNTTPVTVEADEVIGDLNRSDNDLTYKGRVVIAQKDRVINTDVAHYHASGEQSLTASGKSVMHNGSYTVHTDEDAVYNLKTKFLELKNTTFQANGSVLRGTAAEHTVDNQKGVQEIKSGTITTCPSDDNSWHISASTIEMDRNESFGDAYNATLWAGPVPVFYLPYINFPIKNERKTGLLYPSFSIGSEHSKFSQPIYFNLAPNYDWTFTPAWYGVHRWQFTNQFRFMPWENVSGSLLFNYLPNDTDRTTNYDPTGSHKRWYFHLNTGATFLNSDLTVNLNYQRVRPRDYSYITDLAQPDASVTDDHLIQSLRADYVRPRYTLNAEVRRYQSLIPSSNEITISDDSVDNRPFSMLPRVSGTFSETLGRASYGIYGELTRFALDSFGKYSTETSERAHVEPFLKYHVFDRRGTSLDVGMRGFLTHYEQGDLDKYRNASGILGFDELSRSKTRVLYNFEVRGKTTFERRVLDMRHTQTIEPEFKYQYIPYRKQSDIALYDTTDHLDDYYSLFSFRRFAGIDRIADVNAVTAGVTSRLLDAHDREIMRVGLAQSYSFVPSRVTLYSDTAYSTYPRSLLTGSFDFAPTDRISLHSGAAYNTEDSEFKSYNVSASYKNQGSSVTASYRYYRKANYDIQTLRKQSRDLRQIGFGGTWALSHDYRLTAAIYRDLEQAYNIDRKLAIQREDCCTAVALVWEDYAKMDWTSRKHKRDRILGIEFTFKNFYSVKANGIENPMSTNTHYMPFVDPTNLNR